MVGQGDDGQITIGGKGGKQLSVRDYIIELKPTVDNQIKKVTTEIKQEIQSVGVIANSSLKNVIQSVESKIQ